MVLMTMYTDGDVLVFKLACAETGLAWKSKRRVRRGSFLQGVVEPCVHICGGIDIVVIGGPVEQVHSAGGTLK